MLAAGLVDSLLGPGIRADPASDGPTSDADPAELSEDLAGFDDDPDAPVRDRSTRQSTTRDDARINDLAPRSAGGDRVALHELLRLLDPMILRYCRGHMSGRVGLAGPEDVAQEIMVAVCKALPSYDRTRSVFMSLVYGIASKKVADAYRASARDRSVSTDALPEGVDLGSTPEAAALRDDAARVMGTYLAKLPESARMILVYRLGLNYSADETAALVNMTPGAVRVAQHRALQKLREWIVRGDF